MNTDTLLPPPVLPETAPLGVDVSKGMALIEALLNNAFETAECCIHEGAYLDLICAYDGIKCAALHLAVQADRQALVQLMLQQGANVNIPVAGETALHLACMQSDLEMLKLLLNAGANINAKNNLGNTPLHCAIFMGKTNHVQMLLKENAKCDLKNKIGKTPLFAALQIQDEQAVRFLLEAGAEVNVEIPLQNNPARQSLIRYALQYSSLACIKEFLSVPRLKLYKRDIASLKAISSKDRDKQAALHQRFPQHFMAPTVLLEEEQVYGSENGYDTDNDSDHNTTTSDLELTVSRAQPAVLSLAPVVAPALFEEEHVYGREDGDDADNDSDHNITTSDLELTVSRAQPAVLSLAPVVRVQQAEIINSDHNSVYCAATGTKRDSTKN